MRISIALIAFFVVVLVLTVIIPTLDYSRYIKQQEEPSSMSSSSSPHSHFLQRISNKELQKEFLFAAQHGNCSYLQEILSTGRADLTSVLSGRGVNSLYLSAESGFDQCLKSLLVEISANNNVLTGQIMEMTDNLGFTALHRAAYCCGSKPGCRLSLDLLVAAGANVNAISTRGYTPLHLATMSQSESCVKTLLENGAVIGARTVEGRDTFSFANKAEMKKLLEDHRFDVVPQKGGVFSLSSSSSFNGSLFSSLLFWLILGGFLIIIISLLCYLVMLKNKVKNKQSMMKSQQHQQQPPVAPILVLSEEVNTTRETMTSGRKRININF